MSISRTVTSTIAEVGTEQNKTLAPLSDDLALLDSGLDSLSLAIIVARLEDELGLDPFSAAEETPIPITVGDFVRLYENAAG